MSFSETFPSLMCSVAIGCFIGFVCRSRILVALLLSVAGSLGWMMIGAWWVGNFSNQFSLDQPLAMLLYLGWPYVMFYFLPTAIPALAMAIVLRYRRNRREPSV